MTFAKRAPIIFPPVVLAFMVGLAFATQDVAGALHYPREVGPGLTGIGPVKIYSPWAFADWYFRYQRSDPQVFAEATCGGRWRPA